MTGTAVGLGTGRVIPRAPGAALRSEHPWLGPCQPAPRCCQQPGQCAHL